MTKKILLLAAAFAAILGAQTTTSNLGLMVPSYAQQNWHIPMDYNLNKLDQLVLQNPGLANSGFVFATGNTASRLATQSDMQALLGQAGTSTSGWLSSTDWNRFNTIASSALAPPSSSGLVKWVSGTTTVDAATSDITSLLSGSSLSVGAVSSNTLSLLSGSFSAGLQAASGMSASYSWTFPAADANGVVTVNNDQLALYATLPIQYTTSFVSSDPTGSCTNAATLTVKNVAPYDITACISGTWQVIGSGSALTNPMTTAGDIIVGGASGTPTRLGIGSNGQLLGVVNGSLAYVNPGVTGTSVQVQGVASNSTLNIQGGSNVSLSTSNTGSTTLLTINASSNGITQLTGDGTAGPGSGSQALNLATVNSSPGTCGGATQSCQITTDAKGRVIAQTPITITGTGGGGVQAQLYNQNFTNATSVAIPHNLNSLNVIPIVVDSNGNVIEYQSFTLNDANDATLTFATAQSGTVRVMTTSAGIYAQNFTGQTSVSIAHNLGSTALFATVYDGSNNVIGYNTLQFTDANDATLSFAVAQSGRVVLMNP